MMARVQYTLSGGSIGIPVIKSAFECTLKKFTVQIRKSHFATCTSLHLLPLLQYGGNVIIR